MVYSESRHTGFTGNSLRALMREEDLSGKIVGQRHIRYGRILPQEPINAFGLILEEDIVVYRMPKGWISIGPMDEELFRTNPTKVSDVYACLKKDEILVLEISGGLEPRIRDVRIGKRAQYDLRNLPYA
jgi:hypothetical protein